MELPSIRRRNAASHKESSFLASGFNPVLARVFAARKVESPDDLQTDLARLPDWRTMHDLDRAARLIAQHIKQQQKIVVLSDYDADGATGCATMMRGLLGMGAKADFVVPLRNEHGYGLTVDIVPQILAKQPAMVITVDAGISSVDGIKLLKDAGICVIVTDHHPAPPVLPNADAIVNPNQPACRFVSKSIAGVGVAFFVLIALRSVLKEDGYFEGGRPIYNLATLLPIVALGTVADVVPLDHLNRILVSHGLHRIRQGQAPVGINSLALAARRSPERLLASDLGFYLGPRLNAAGRLDDMSKGVRCLVTDNESEALSIAAELEALNAERKAIQNGVQVEADAQIENPTANKAICAAGDWHSGVVGIVAGRIKEQHRRPAIVFSEADEKGLCKGSGRGVPGYHLRDALARIDAMHAGVILKFGGHPMAAGLTVHKDSIAAFRVAFLADADANVPDAALQNIIETDGVLTERDFTLQTAEAIESMVWGQEFPEPVFDGEFIVRQHKVIAERHLRLTLSPVSAPQVSLEAMWFGGAGQAIPAEGHFAFRLSVNEWKNRRTLQAFVISPVTVTPAALT